MLKYIYIISVVILTYSCVSSEKIIYFQDIDDISLNDSINEIKPVIQKGDLLLINVSATDAEAALPFNLYNTPVVQGTQYSNLKPVKYLVDDKGEINFPVVGKLNVVGYTSLELNDELTSILSNGYITDPIVNIRIANFKINVLGEVKNPGSYVVENERVNIIEALSMAGDLTIHGKRADIILIRNINGNKEHVKIDLRSSELFNSEYFYLVQNDIIYVAPNKAKINSSSVGTHTAVLVSSFSLLIALMAILIK